MSVYFCPIGAFIFWRGFREGSRSVPRSTIIWNTRNSCDHHRRENHLCVTISQWHKDGNTWSVFFVFFSVNGKLCLVKMLAQNIQSRYVEVATKSNFRSVTLTKHYTAECILMRQTHFIWSQFTALVLHQTFSHLETLTFDKCCSYRWVQHMKPVIVKVRPVLAFQKPSGSDIIPHESFLNNCCQSDGTHTSTVAAFIICHTEADLHADCTCTNKRTHTLTSQVFFVVLFVFLFFFLNILYYLIFHWYWEFF